MPEKPLELETFVNCFSILDNLPILIEVPIQSDILSVEHISQANSESFQNP